MRAMGIAERRGGIGRGEKDDVRRARGRVATAALWVAAAAVASAGCAGGGAHRPEANHGAQAEAPSPEVGQPSGTRLRIICDIPEQVGHSGTAYPARIDWADGSESFTFVLSREDFEVQLDKVVTPGKARIFFVVDDPPKGPTKFSRGEWFIHPRKPKVVDEGRVICVRLSWFQNADDFSSMFPPT